MAVYQGPAGKLSYSWNVNGNVLENAKGDRLPVGSYQKGDTVTVTVFNRDREYHASTDIGNIPPRILKVGLKNPKICRNVDIELDVVAADDDRDDIALDYTWFRNNEPLDFIEGNVLPGSQIYRGDHIRFVVVPHDDASQGVPYQSAEIVIPDAPPQFVTAPPKSFSAMFYSYRAKAEDPDGDVISYSLETAPPGMSIDANSGLVEWDLTHAMAGEHAVSIVAYDSAGQKAYQDFSLVIQQP